MPSTIEPRALHQTDGGAARLRADIDRGQTGDKVDAPDPAAAPLGTDDEAGGWQAPPGTLDRLREAETSGHERTRHGRGWGAAWILIGIIVLIGVCLVANLIGARASP